MPGHERGRDPEAAEREERQGQEQADETKRARTRTSGARALGGRIGRPARRVEGPRGTLHTAAVCDPAGRASPCTRALRRSRWRSRALPAGADDDANAPFERISLPLRAAARGLDAGRERERERVAVVSALGSPPDERRHLAIYGPAPGGGVAREVVLDVPTDAVAFDVADLEPAARPSLRCSTPTG